jgi:hypothetical protein
MGGTPFPITLDQMIHGAAVFEAITASAAANSKVQVAP